MTVFEYGNLNAGIVLVQPVDDHDMSVMDSEVRYIRELTDKEFGLIAVKVENWNTDLSPWAAPAVFGNEGFGNGAADTLTEIMELINDPCKAYIIGGYSLAGLFALWAATRTDLFCGVAAASPSVWFPGFIDYMADHIVHTGTVYLSLGDKEERTRNPVMSKVGECIREGYSCLQRKGVDCTLEWNSGNHFKEPDLRTAKAFAWVMEQEMGLASEDLLLNVTFAENMEEIKRELEGTKEYLDIVDENGQPTGQIICRDDAHTDGILHRTAHVWVVRKTGQGYDILLQKRSEEKDSFPGLYDTSSAGHIPAGDEPLESAIRELKEELGIAAASDQLHYAGSFRIRYEKEFHGRMFRDNEVTWVYVYENSVDISTLKLQKSEVSEVRWFDLDEVWDEIKTDRNRFCVPTGGLNVLREYLKGQKA